METQTFRELSAPKIRILKLIWAFLTGSVIIYGALVFAIPEITQAGAAGNTHTPNILFFLAIGAGLASFFLRRFFLSDNRIKQVLEQPLDTKKLATNRQTGELDENKLRKVDSLNDFEQKLLTLLELYFLPNIISWALNESIAIFGLVLAILEGDPNALLPFVGAALLLNVAMFPKYSTFIARAKSLGRR